MWEQGPEINKVVLNFLRQILGVHKKTTSLAILAETGKYPLIIKIYTLIFKYWMRLEKTENKLLLAAHSVNKFNNRGTSWIKIVEYLLEITEMTGTIRSNDTTENNRIIKKFKNNLTTQFNNWWGRQAIITGHNKLDFYYKHKKVFRFESYLDNINRNTRKYITKLRMSSHCLPIEVLRYKNTNRDERLCKICDLRERGDEEHYLLTCKNNKIKCLRNTFIEKIRNEVSQLVNFSEQNIIDYCMNMNDLNIQRTTAVFIQNLLKIYKEETNVPPLYIICSAFIQKQKKQIKQAK